MTMSPFPARLGNRGYIKPLENRLLFPRDWEIAVLAGGTSALVFAIRAAIYNHVSF